MTSRQRISIALSAGKPDRVPLALPFTFYGAKVSDVSIAEYFSRPDLVVDAQVMLHSKFRQDAVTSSFYPALQIEAWHGDVSFPDGMSPVVGIPLIRRPEDINNIEQPKIRDCVSMLRCLEVTRRLNSQLGDDTPIMAAVVSPFNLPLMQMEEEAYSKLIQQQPRLFERLMAVNEEMCVEWTNALFHAGVTFVVCSDPAASSGFISREQYLSTGLPVLCSYVSRVNGPVVLSTHPSESRPIIEDIIQSGAKALSPGATENPPEVAAASRGRIATVGGLNLAQTRAWTSEQVESRVKDAIAQLGTNGGLVLSDNSSEVAWSASEETLATVSDAVHTWGQYPLQWAG